ncbi:hypothetical protein LBMAG53_12630 [Planctomycetota bacterium]|nr:hypothetical protein LBMAG53_12630 [Planctomycetota bacterium]
MSVTFVGDIHGWSDRLGRILTQAEGHVVFLGDLLDRGPDAPTVIACVRDLVEGGEATCVLGNHEYALIRSLGCPALGIPAEEDLFFSWLQGYGGMAVCDAFGVDTVAGLRGALGSHIDWLASLPWVAEGGTDGNRWIAVHAGLAPDRPTDSQLAGLRRGWDAVADNLGAISAKGRAHLVPFDLPQGTVVVSGHTPVPIPWVTGQRILCDTSGGLLHRQLSGVIWPDGRIIRS